MLEVKVSNVSDVSYHVCVTCLWPGCHICGWRGCWWNLRQDGKKTRGQEGGPASDNSLRLCFKSVGVTQLDIMRESSGPFPASGDQRTNTGTSPVLFVATKTGILRRILIFPWPWTTEVAYYSIITELFYHKIEKWTTFILAVVEVWLEESSSCMKQLTARSVVVTLRSWLQERKIECHLVPLTSREAAVNKSCITQQFAAVMEKA